jgi:hypothetical protein
MIYFTKEMCLQKMNFFNTLLFTHKEFKQSYIQFTFNAQNTTPLFMNALPTWRK